jgi:hypothetical protein
MSPALHRRLAALEARLGERERKLRRRSVWWDVLGGEPPPVAEPGEELHVHRWLLPDEEVTPEAAGAGGETALPEARRRGGERRPVR